METAPQYIVRGLVFLWTACPLKRKCPSFTALLRESCIILDKKRQTIVDFSSFFFLLQRKKYLFSNIDPCSLFVHGILLLVFRSRLSFTVYSMPAVTSLALLIPHIVENDLVFNPNGTSWGGKTFTVVFYLIVSRKCQICSTAA